MKQVTVWKLKNAAGEWEHNHIEDGWSERHRPMAMNREQTLAWHKRDWLAEHKHLNEANEIV